MKVLEKTLQNPVYYSPFLALFLALLATGLQEFKLLEQWNYLVYDFEIKSLSRPVNKDIVIVAIDEYSIQQLGRWPWPRSIHARLINQLTESNVKAIGMDILFHEPDIANLAADEQLVNAIRHNEHVVLPVFLASTNVKPQLLQPLAGLSEAASQLGHVNIVNNGQGVVRGLILKTQINQRYLPSFALALYNAGNSNKQNPLQFKTQQANNNSNEIWQNQNHVLIPYSGPVGHFQQISYADLFNQKLLLDQLEDKYVLVGMTAAGLGQRFATSVSKHTELMSGVEFHANVLDALLENILIYPLDKKITNALTFILVFLPLLLNLFLRPSFAFLLALLFICLTFIISLSLLIGMKLWFGPIPTVLTLLIGFPFWSWQRLELVAHSLFIEKEKANTTLHAISDAVISTSAEGLVEFMNSAAEKMTGFSLKQAKRQPLEKILTIQEKTDQGEFTPIQNILHKNISQNDSVSHVMINRYGQEYAIRFASNLIYEETGTVSGVVLAFSDLTEILKINQQMTFLSNYDTLTKLPNRSLLEDRLTQAINAANRLDNFLAVLFIDLDGFKKINDGLGHNIGDLLLQDVAIRIQNNLRQMDTTARWGGDEFVVLLKNLTQEDLVSEIARKINLSIEQPFNIKDEELFITASIGISVFPKDGMTANLLLARADAAMYDVKKSGRNNFQCFSQDMNHLAQERLLMEKELHYALETGGFKIYYLPQFDLKSGQLVGVEALLRWQRQENILLTPDKFISVADNIGLTLPICEWVIKQVCTQIKNWQQKKLPEISIAINFFPRQFIQKSLVNLIIESLSKNNISPKRLQIVITESLMLDDINQVIEILNELKKTGIMIIIDDFGTGYSSLNYLKRLPIDKLIIDRSFVNNIFADPNDANIVKAVISLAHNMHMQTIADGIETKSQMQTLSEWGCDIGQGMYFKNHLTYVEMTDLLHQNQFKNLKTN